MKTLFNSAFIANLGSKLVGACLINFRAVATQTTFSAKMLSFVIALATIGAMATIVCGTFIAKLGSVDVRAYPVVARTVVAQTTFSAKMCNSGITLVTTWAMSVRICGAIKAKAHPVVATARSVYFFYTIIAPTTFLTPFAHDIIARFTVGTVGTFFICALKAHSTSGFLVGAAVTNLRAGTIGTYSALNTQIYTFLAFVAFATIWLTVNPFLTVRA